MRQIFLRIYLLFILGFVPSVSHAFAHWCETHTPETTRVYHINGINVKIDGAAENVLALNDILKIPSSQASVHYSHNDNDGFFTDFKEAYIQLHSDPGNAIDYWQGMFGTTSNMPNWYRKEITAKTREWAVKNYYSDPVLMRMVDRYVKDLKSGKKVVLVPHSQGNFYNLYRKNGFDRGYFWRFKFFLYLP